jgi:hypothetical protein
MRTPLLFVGVCACAGNSAVETKLFPADYESSYTMVRPCRSSADHNLHHVTVFADPTAAEPYMNRDAAFPTGGVVLKPEYDETDMTCTGPIIEWTVMVKVDTGTAPQMLDWHWQDIGSDRDVITDNSERCWSCHTACGIPGEGGYDGTCSQP